jgi:hypothetical protein
MLTTIRKFYRIPPDILASHLGIGRSHLSMAESGRRKVKNQERLMSFYLATLLEPETIYKDEKTEQALAAQKEDLERSIDRTLKIKEYKLSQVKKLLAKMKENQASSFRILRTVPSLRAIAAKKELSLLNFIENNARILQRKTCDKAQLKLELQIQKFQAEIRYLKKHNK